MFRSAYIRQTLPQAAKNTSKVRTISGLSFATWGENNEYPLFLNYLYTKSAPHRAFIDGKVQYYLSVLDSIPQELDNNGFSKEKLGDVIGKCLKDYELKNAFAIKATYNALYKRKDLEYINIDKIRISKNGENIYVSNDWKDRNSPIEIYPNLSFDPTKENGIYVYFGDVYDYIDEDGTLVKGYYPSPTYSSAINSIMADIAIAEFDYTEISTGFKAGTVISLNDGVPETKEEQREIIDDIRKKLTDKNKYGGILVLFSSSRENSPEINQVNGNDLVDRYSQLRNEVLQRIIIAHNITSPLLVGVKTSGQLGGSTEMQDAKMIFEEKYIKPRLNSFIKFINGIIPNVLKIKMSKPERIWVDDDSETIKRVLNEVSKFGTSIKDIELLDVSADNDTEMSEKLSHIQQSEIILTQLQDNVLSMFMQGEDLTNISQALGVGIREVATAYDELTNMKLITEENRVTRLGKEVAKQGQLLQVFYQYKARPGLGPDIIPTTREFCRKMVEHTQTKLLTRKDIDEISNRVGRDVWYYRGGAYHDSSDGKDYPYCRHIWVQQLGVINKE